MGSAWGGRVAVAVGVLVTLGMAALGCRVIENPEKPGHPGAWTYDRKPAQPDSPPPARPAGPPPAPIPTLFYEIGLRVVEVSSGRTAFARNLRAEGSSQLSEAAAQFASALAASLPAKALVAVLDPDETNAPARDEGIGVAFGGILHSAVAATDRVQVVERQKLAQILREQRMRDVGVLQDTSQLRRVVPADYLLLGTIAKFRKDG